MNKHTPGPWSWQANKAHRVAIDGHDGTEVIRAEEYAGSAWIDISEENARLIAAAPELLETLKAIRDAEWRGWEELASPEEFVRWAKSRANHAISKANGESE